jgi:hypothetical protein
MSCHSSLALRPFRAQLTNQRIKAVVTSVAGRDTSTTTNTKVFELRHRCSNPVWTHLFEHVRTHRPSLTTTSQNKSTPHTNQHSYSGLASQRWATDTLKINEQVQTLSELFIAVWIPSHLSKFKVMVFMNSSRQTQFSHTTERKKFPLIVETLMCAWLSVRRVCPHSTVCWFFLLNSSTEITPPTHHPTYFSFSSVPKENSDSRSLNMSSLGHWPIQR